MTLQKLFVQRFVLRQNGQQLMFFQNILKSKVCDNSIQARKKLFCQVIVKNYLCNFLCKFFFQNRKHVEVKNQRMTLLYCGRTIRSKCRKQRCSTKKNCFLKFPNFLRKHLCRSLLLKKLQV